MSEGDAKGPLRDLGRRLERARQVQSGKGPEGSRPGGQQTVGAALAFAWRIGVELVVAVVVGTGIGWAIDWALGTRPWAMVVLFFLGVAAGMLNVWRTVKGMGMAIGYRRPGESGPNETPKDDWDDED
jgi:ATP synthase protein I